ncbi:proton-conducting transporter transmembrane domain-containing protein [Anaplasma bovis]|uniref:proton-conducting transporter transmembrane domain-containing protein n=1 Tax=Anaplasma bovis TaxID=186733 RepID=UPI002FEE9BB3
MIGVFIDNMIVLVVLVPLLAAVLCPLLSSRTWLVQIVSCSAVLFSFVTALVLFFNVKAGGPIVYRVGGWDLPYGIELKVDLLSATMLALVGFIGVVSIIYGIYPSNKEISAHKVPRFYAVFLMAFGGLLGILVSNDAFNVYVFLEVASIATYVLVAMGGGKEALVSAFEYLIVGTIGATFYLLGVGFLYANTGTLNMGSMFAILQDIPMNRVIYAGILFVILGLIMKAALFPFHGWLVKTYAASPSFIVVFLSGTSTKVMIYLVIRVVYSVFGRQLVLVSLPFGNVMLVLAAVAMIVASVFSIFNEDIRSVLAYSSIASVGCIIFAVCINTYAGLAAAIAYMVNHSVVKSALFMVFGGISYHFGKSDVGKCLSLSRVVPSISAAFVLLSLSLVGMPPTVGFVVKWHMLSSFADAGAWVGLAALSMGSVCSVIYTWKVVEYLYFSPRMVDTCANDISVKTPYAMTSCIWVMVVLGLAAGAYPLPLTSISEQIAADLFSACQG